jgi:carbon monoxide dehydrogenase subunit G
MSMVQQAIEVGAPLHRVYEQLATFENYPRFMTGVEQVTPIGDQRTHWVMDVDGHRREFDAQITELSFDERVSWTTTDGPRLTETITVRPMGETRTQVVAQLEADIAFLMPSDRHGQETLNRRLKHDLSTLKGLIESGRMAPAVELGRAGSKQAGSKQAGSKQAGSRQAGSRQASSKQVAGRSSTIFGSGAELDPASPASVAARVRPNPTPGAGWGTSSGADAPDAAVRGTNVDITSAPGITSAADLDNVLAPGRRIASRRSVSGGAAGSAPMGGRTNPKDVWGDGMINEEDRGSAHDF